MGVIDASDWRSCLRSGLELERKGRLAEAERAFALALRCGARAAPPHEEYARFLANAGRVKEALPHLRRCLEMEDRSLNAYLTAGRLLETQERFKEAEAAFLKGLRFGRAAKARKEQLCEAYAALGRLRERMGLLKKAASDFRRAVALRPGSARAHGGLGAVLLKLRRKSAAEESLRRALALEPRLGETRLRLIDVLTETGRPALACRELGRLLSRRDGLGPEQLTDAAVRLVEAGGGKPLLRVLLRHLRREGGERGWSKVFSALLCAGRGADAFAVGEEMLDGFVAKADPFELSRLQWPWFWDARAKRAVAERPFCERRLGELEPAPEPWRSFCRCVLLSALGRREEALALRATVAAAPAERFFWMRLPFVLLFLEGGDYAAAAAECSAVLERRPDLWWARCRLAEALLAQSLPEEALRQLEQAERIAAGNAASRREILTWHGEVLLWLGRCAEALAKLDAAVALGATTFVYGWRGAARLKLGLDTLPDLDRAVALDAKDVEALVWRGEAKRLAGREREAIADLDLAIARYGQGHLWAHLNRALARQALGDEAGMREDFARVPADVVEFLREKTGLEEASSCAAIAALARAGLEGARGIRRMEPYLKPVWMGR